MKQWTVTVTAHRMVWQDIEVAAETRDEAEQAALDQAGMGSSSDWENDDSVSDLQVTDVDEGDEVEDFEPPTVNNEVV